MFFVQVLFEAISLIIHNDSEPNLLVSNKCNPKSSSAVHFYCHSCIMDPFVSGSSLQPVGTVHVAQGDKSQVQ